MPIETLTLEELLRRLGALSRVCPPRTPVVFGDGLGQFVRLAGAELDRLDPADFGPAEESGALGVDNEADPDYTEPQSWLAEDFQGAGPVAVVVLAEGDCR